MIKVNYSATRLTPKEVLLLYEKRLSLKKAIGNLFKHSSDKEISKSVDSLRQQTQKVSVLLTGSKPSVVVEARDPRFKIKLNIPVKLEAGENGKAKYQKILKAKKTLREEMSSRRKQLRKLNTVTREVTFNGHPFNIEYQGRTDIPMTYRQIRLDVGKCDAKTINKAGNFKSPTGGWVHTKPNQIRELMSIKEVNLVSQPKAPKTKEKHVGIEVECLSLSNRQQMSLILAKHGLARYVFAKDDGSLRAEGAYANTHEITVLIPESELELVLSKLDAALKEAKCIANYSCGMHVHLDMRHRDHKVAFHNLVLAQGVLFRLVHPNRNKSQYCRVTQTPDIDDFLTSGGQKYSGVNANPFKSIKTIELRMHHGCVNTATMLQWCRLLVKIADKEDKLPAPTDSFKGFVEAFKLDEPIVNFMKERLTKFKDAKQPEGENYV